jgi:hypothetical protein
MNDGKKIMPAVGACVAVLMTIICVGAANTSTKTAAQPPIPKAGPLAQPKSPQQGTSSGRPDAGGHTTGQSANA